MKLFPRLDIALRCLSPLWHTQDTNPVEMRRRCLCPHQPNVLIIGDSISMTPPYYTTGGYGGALEVCFDCMFSCLFERESWTHSSARSSSCCYRYLSQALLAASGIYAQHASAGGEYSGGQAFSTLRGLNCTDAAVPGTYFNPPPSRLFDLIYVN
jgi:hypothetical protein